MKLQRLKLISFSGFWAKLETKSGIINGANEDVQGRYQRERIRN